METRRSFVLPVTLMLVGVFLLMIALALAMGSPSAGMDAGTTESSGLTESSVWTAVGAGILGIGSLALGVRTLTKR